MTTVEFRRARLDDLPAIVAMLGDDILGRQREDRGLPLNSRYLEAFTAIDSDPNQLQIVAIIEGDVAGTLQLTFVPGLARIGAWRGQIEGVRIAADHRNTGIGRQMFQCAIEQCQAKGCSLVQLTTDNGRPDAHRFYESLGFIHTHAGYKLTL